MDSKTINEKIRELEDDEDRDFQALNNKPISYIGWFWREVDFDAGGVSIGRCKTEQTFLLGMPFEGPSDFFGFMENNKWDYDEYWVTADLWIEIKATVIAFVENPTVETSKASFDALQKVRDLVKVSD